MTDTNASEPSFSRVAPSALLGFQLGGIVGHRFLSNYRVGIDLERSMLRLKRISS